MQLYAQIAEPDNHGIGLDEVVPVTKDWREYEYKFQAKQVAASNNIAFSLGERTGTVWVADFSLTKEAKPRPLEGRPGT